MPLTVFLFLTLGTVIFLIAAAFVCAYVCYRMIFYSDRSRVETEEFPIPKGKVYEPFRDEMVGYLKAVRAMPHLDVEITSFDGLKLRGRFYEYEKGAPIEIMFHGYRGTSERDLSGGVLRARKLGRSTLLVDHRGHGTSEGKVITFGVLESRDAIDWVNYVTERIDPDARIILTGVSMGAATVMITAGKELPKNVVGVLADCGYTSAEAIIKKVMREMKLPAGLLYPFARMGAKVYGGFDLDSESPVKSMEECRLPVIFIHGDGDDFVPHGMSVENHAACASSHKLMVTVPTAGHGTCYMTDPELYLKSLDEFFGPLL